MGLQTEIAKIIFNIDPPLFVEWEQETDYVKEASYIVANQVIAKIREVVEEVENPYPMATPFEYFTGPKGHGRDGFEKARQAILKAIKED